MADLAKLVDQCNNYRMALLSDLSHRMQTVADMQEEIEVLKLKTAPIENGNLVWAWRKPAADIPAGWKECGPARPHLRGPEGCLPVAP